MYYFFLSFMMISFFLFPQASLPSMNFNILELIYFSDSIRRIQTSAKKSPSFPVHKTYSECCEPRLFCLVNGNFRDYVTVLRPPVCPQHRHTKLK